MKTFDDAVRRAQRRSWPRATAGSGTVAAVDAGVHTIGKKLVEEAAEAWMAAEHESKERAAEELSQLLYHAQVMMLACGLTPRRRLRPPVTHRPLPPTRSSEGSDAQDRRPNKGSLADSAAQIAARGRLPAAPRRAATW